MNFPINLLLISKILYVIQTGFKSTYKSYDQIFNHSRIQDMVILYNGIKYNTMFILSRYAMFISFLQDMKLNTNVHNTDM